jgi:hypothetical protein
MCACLPQVPPSERAAKYNKVCATAPLRVLKEIRLNTVGPVLQDRQAFKMLHLVRRKSTAAAVVVVLFTTQTSYMQAC